MIRLVDTVIVYEESICRVKKLSLSGAILYYTGMVDCLLVQWPGLKKQYPRATYVKDLVDTTKSDWIELWTNFSLALGQINY